MIDKKPITDFSDLLTNIGMNPKEVQMIRHTASVQEGMNETYYWLWKENPKKFDEENAWQKKDQFKDRKYLVVFVVTPTKETLFTRFYKINELTEKISEDRKGHFYNLEPDSRLKEYEGRLKIDWGWGAEKAWAQIAGNTPKRILSDGKIHSFDELVPGKSYIRTELREAFGGNRQRGIVTLPKHNAIFLMPSRKNKDIGYEARWDDGVYYLSGEGLTGDQKLTVGNKALKESIGTDKPIYLFEPLIKKEPYTHIFHSQVKCIEYEEYRGPDKDGNLRKMFRFYFQSSEHPDFQNIGYNKIMDEVREEVEEDYIKESISETSVSTKERKLSTQAYETARKEAVTRQQLENKLVADYINYLSEKGYETKHSQVDLIAEKNGKTIYIEAKILKGPTTAAHGLGQILHYDFILDKKADELALLFDRKPNEQTIEFIKQFKVKITYKEKDNFITI